MFIDNAAYQHTATKSPFVAAYYRYVRGHRVTKLVKPEFWVFGMAFCSARYLLAA